MADSPSAQQLPSDEVLLSVSGPVATIRLNRPERRNSFTGAFMDSLADAVEAAIEAAGVRVVVLTGGERCFSVGGDLEEFSAGAFAPAHMTVEESAAELRHRARAVELLRASDRVSVAAVSGPCAGAGFSLAAACDLRIASTTAVFRTAFIGAGLASDYGGLWSLTRLVGEARAKELFLLNTKLSAERALDIGLVSAVVDPTGLEQAAAEVAETLAAQAPLALSAIKRLFTAQPGDFSAALDEESLAQKRLAYTSDAREAARSFVERRAPRFGGA
ncbi:MAG: enoyl-CoA hydratase/isomerase family protein [Leucobacter sp.]